MADRPRRTIRPAVRFDPSAYESDSTDSEDFVCETDDEEQLSVHSSDEDFIDDRSEGDLSFLDDFDENERELVLAILMADGEEIDDDEDEEEEEEEESARRVRRRIHSEEGEVSDEESAAADPAPASAE